MMGRFWNWIRARQRGRYLAGLRKRGLRIGQEVSIEDGFFFDPSHCYLIEIGSRCTFAPNVRLIAHDASVRRWLGATQLAKVIIEDDCFIGDSVIVLPGVTVGQGSVIGAGAVVTRSIPPCSVAVGNPARVIGDAVEYRERLKQQIATYKVYSPDYWIENATEARIAEIVEATARGITFIR